MAKAYAMIANGTEEAECLGVVDILRRSGVETVLVSAEDGKDVVSSHDVRIQADATVAETDFSDGDLIFLPGGMPGSERLSACEPLMIAVKQAIADGRRIAAICAAPAVVLGRHGLLDGRRASCYPGFEGDLKGAEYVLEGVVTDGLFTTGKGLGVVLDLGLELVKLLVDEETAEKTRKAIQY